MCKASHHQMAVLPVLLRRFCLALTNARMSASACWSPVRGMEEEETVVGARALKSTHSITIHTETHMMTSLKLRLWCSGHHNSKMFLLFMLQKPNQVIAPHITEAMC